MNLIRYQVPTNMSDKNIQTHRHNIVCVPTNMSDKNIQTHRHNVVSIKQTSNHLYKHFAPFHIFS